MGDSPRSNGKGQNGASPHTEAGTPGASTGRGTGRVAERTAESLAEPNQGGVRGFEVVGRFLEDDRWHPRRLGEHFIYRVDYASKHGSLRCYAEVRVELEQVVFYVVAPVKAPPEIRPALAEFVTRANYGMRIGNFELDYGDGEVRYKSALDFEGVALTPRLVRNLIYPAVSTMDRYLPGVLAVISGGVTAVDAIDQVEGED